MRTLLELIPPPSLPVSTTDSVRDKIIERLKALALDKGQFKLDLKVLLWVCTCVESSIEKNVKVNKKDLVLDVFRHVYGLSSEDELFLKNNIDILHSTKRIKRKHYFRLFLTSIREIFTL